MSPLVSSGSILFLGGLLAKAGWVMAGAFGHPCGAAFASGGGVVHRFRLSMWKWMLPAKVGMTVAGRKVGMQPAEVDWTVAGRMVRMLPAEVDWTVAGHSAMVVLMLFRHDLGLRVRHPSRPKSCDFGAGAAAPHWTLFCPFLCGCCR